MKVAILFQFQLDSGTRRGRADNAENIVYFYADKYRLVDRSVKIITNNPFGLSLSKAGIGAGLAVRQAHRER